MEQPNLSIQGNDSDPAEVQDEKGIHIDQNEVVIEGSSGIQCRYVLTLMTFLGFCNNMATRGSFNVALVAMVNFTAEEGVNGTSNECPGYLNSTADQQEGEFDWSSDTQSLMLGAFFYGYVVTQFPGGYLAERFGAKKVFGLATLIPGILTLLIPTLARWHPATVIACRIIMGLAQGSIYPATLSLWGKWAPPQERSKLVSISVSGGQFGYICALSISGYLAGTDFLGGWPSPFYVFGACNCLWFILWIFLAYDTPDTHPRISAQEKAYILGGLHNSGNETYISPPWRSIFTSRAFWTIVAYDFLDGIAFYVYFSAVPIFMKEILKFDISSNGLLISLPYLASMIMSWIGGAIADHIRTRKWLSPTATCKLFNTLGEGSVGVCMLAIAFVDCNQIAAVALLVLGMGMNGLVSSGVVVNVIDMAPRYAGTIMGLANPLGNIGGFVTPAIVSAITGKNQGDKGKWQIVFFMAAGVYLMATLVYLLFADAREQKWAQGEDEENKRREAEDKERLLVE